LRVLRAVHDAPTPPTRALVTRQLGLGRGTATVLVAELKGRALLAEADTVARAGPGRPTAQLVPHRDGPVVLAAAITHDGWTVDAVELGGGVVHELSGGHDRRRGVGVLDNVAAACRTLTAHLGHRVGAFALSLPATVRGDRVAQASILGWDDVDALRPFAWLGVPSALANDATAAGIGEARRGAARGRDVVLHVHADAGVGGTLLLDGRPAPDAQGAGGEFGHMPLAGGDGRCRCGARGCWDLDVGNLALVGGARRVSVRSAAARLLDGARAGDREALDRVGRVAAALGRGVGALVNGHDPELVTLSGVAATIAGLMPDRLGKAYGDALMRFRRAAPPPLTPSVLDGRGQRIGTAELAFDHLLTEAVVVRR
jgi:predicted NBD/HSP70 family sugar kinase